MSTKSVTSANGYTIASSQQNDVSTNQTTYQNSLSIPVNQVDEDQPLYETNKVAKKAIEKMLSNTTKRRKWGETLNSDVRIVRRKDPSGLFDPTPMPIKIREAPQDS